MWTNCPICCSATHPLTDLPEHATVNQAHLVTALGRFTALQQVLEGLPSGSSNDPLVAGLLTLHPSIGPLAPFHNRILHVREALAVLPAALNDSIDIAAAVAQYQAIRSADPNSHVTYVDNLLSPAALESLRRFCVESTVWYHQKSIGYVGSYWAEGFSNPLLLQVTLLLRVLWTPIQTYPNLMFPESGISFGLPIAEELRHKFPRILGQLRVVNVYFSLGEGSCRFTHVASDVGLQIPFECVVWNQRARRRCNNQCKTAIAFYEIMATLCSATDAGELLAHTR